MLGKQVNGRFFAYLKSQGIKDRGKSHADVTYRFSERNPVFVSSPF